MDVNLRTRDQTAEGAAAGAGFAVLVLVGAAVALLVLPGALLVFGAVETFGLHLDRGQLWTSASVISALIIGTLRVAVGDWSGALHRYVGASVAIGAVTLVCRFGLHAGWPIELLGMFINHG
jgi:hypothetical protein